MPKIIYPFAAIPNQIARGGHGAINLAVLVCLMSHGRTSCSAETIAREVGCNKKSVYPAIQYWIENGEANGLLITKKEKNGASSVIEIDVLTCGKADPKTGQVDVDNPVDTITTSPENGSGGHPKTGHLPDPKTGHKEEGTKEYIKGTPLPPINSVFNGQGDEAGKATTGNRIGPKPGLKPFIDGDPAWQDPHDPSKWKVKIHTGEWVEYSGSLKKLEWRKEKMEWKEASQK